MLLTLSNKTYIKRVCLFNSDFILSNNCLKLISSSYTCATYFELTNLVVQTICEYSFRRHNVLQTSLVDKYLLVYVTNVSLKWNRLDSCSSCSVDDLPYDSDRCLIITTNVCQSKYKCKKGASCNVNVLICLKSTFLVQSKNTNWSVWETR